MAKLTLNEFDKKWDRTAYDAMIASCDGRKYRKFITDCYDMYETEGFCETFNTTYSDYIKYNGKKFKKIRRAKKSDGYDTESLPAWQIEFEDGVKIFAYPEEICKAERKVN